MRRLYHAKTPKDLENMITASSSASQPPTLLVMFGFDKPGVTRLRHALFMANMPIKKQQQQNSSTTHSLTRIMSTDSKPPGSKFGANVLLFDQLTVLDLPSFPASSGGNLQRLDYRFHTWFPWFDAIMRAGTLRKHNGRAKSSNPIISLMAVDATADGLPLDYRSLLDYWTERLNGRSSLNMVLTQPFSESESKGNAELLARQLIVSRWLLDGYADISPTSGMIKMPKNRVGYPPTGKGQVFACNLDTAAGLWPLKRWLAEEMGFSIQQDGDTRQSQSFISKLDPISGRESGDDGRVAEMREKFRLRPFTKTQSRGPGIYQRTKLQKQRQHQRK